MNATTNQLPKLRDVERKAILERLNACNGKKPDTAKSLGISLKTLYNKLNYYKGEDR